MSDQPPDSKQPTAMFPGDGGRFALPWDLSEWIPPDQLWQWTLEEVERLGWDQPELVAFLAKQPNYHPRLLLSILGYAYTLGVFEDREVADLALSDPQVRAWAGAAVVRKREINNFRKANRGLIKWLLVELFRRVLQHRFQIEGALLPAGLKRWLVLAATARLELARTMVRGFEEA